jgi:hypothetical protein
MNKACVGLCGVCVCVRMCVSPCGVSHDRFISTLCLTISLCFCNTFHHVQLHNRKDWAVACQINEGSREGFRQSVDLESYYRS